MITIKALRKNAVYTILTSLFPAVAGLSLIETSSAMAADCVDSFYCQGRWVNPLAEVEEEEPAYVHAIVEWFDPVSEELVIVVGGHFSHIGGIEAYNIAIFHPSNATWSAIEYNSINGIGSVSTIRALAVFGDDLIVGGDLNSAGGVDVSGLARWDGSAWSADIGRVGFHEPGPYHMDTWTTGYYSGVFALSVAPDGNGGEELLVGGNFDYVNGYIICSGISNGPPCQIYSTTVVWGAARIDEEFNVTAVGDALHPLASSLDSTHVFAILKHDGDIYVGGVLEDVPGLARVSYLMRWDGSSWSEPGVVSTLFEGHGGVQSLASWNGDLIAGGQFYDIDSVSSTGGIARWDGTTWHALGGGLIPFCNLGGCADHGVYSMTTSNTNELVVGGLFNADQDHISDGPVLNSLARWNGTGWLPLGIGPGFLPVAALVRNSSGHIFAAGDSWYPGNVSLNEWVQCPADLNCSGASENVVDDADFSIFICNYNVLYCCDAEMSFGCPSDFNGDGLVDDVDFAVFAAAYNLFDCPQ